MCVSFRPWHSETLDRAYDVLLGEMLLPPSAPGGKVDFRLSLTLSFLFRFHLEVLQKLRERVGGQTGQLQPTRCILGRSRRLC